MTALSFRTKAILLAAAAITLVVCGWCIRRDGIAIGKISQKVSDTGKRVDELRPVVAQATQSAQVETKKLVSKNEDYRAARSKVQVKGDSVIADGAAAVMPSVASALIKADSLSVQVAPTVVKEAAKDSVSLLFYKAFDAHDSALEQEKRPRFGTKTGIAIGVASTVGVVYIAVKIIRALGHK